MICETDQTAQMASCYLTGAYLLKAARPPDSRPPATSSSLQRIFHLWGIRRTPSEREDPGSPYEPVTLFFPSNKFPFLAWLPGSLSFPLRSPFNRQYRTILSFCVWLSSVSVAVSRPIHGAANGSIPFFGMANFPLCVCTTRSPSMPLLMDV